MASVAGGEVGKPASFKPSVFFGAIAAIGLLVAFAVFNGEADAADIAVVRGTKSVS